MTDRTVLADALKGATVEMLREDVFAANQTADFEESCREFVMAARYRRLAALALVFAKLDEEGDYSFEKAASLLRGAP